MLNPEASYTVTFCRLWGFITCCPEFFCQFAAAKDFSNEVSRVELFIPKDCWRIKLGSGFKISCALVCRIYEEWLLSGSLLVAKYIIQIFHSQLLGFDIIPRRLVLGCIIELFISLLLFIEISKHSALELP